MAMHLSSLAAERGLRAARAIGSTQEQVVGRRALYAADVPRWLVRRELRVGRWQRAGRQSVVLHNGPLSVAARRWVAVLELGPRAALAGITALQHEGLAVLTDTDIHVIVPRGATRRKLHGVVRHESRRFRETNVRTSGIRRTIPAVSAVQAALWAVTVRQATYLLVVTVQQQLCRVDELADVLATVHRHRWRLPLLTALDDLAGGVRSLGELDVAQAMRGRGLPEPDRQAVRRRASGTEYLDAAFDGYGINLEVDGVQHELPWARLADLLRDLRLAAEGDTVVRIPLVAWRVDSGRVLDALEALFRSRGWKPAAA